jgi:hypothetical protein
MAIPSFPSSLRPANSHSLRFAKMLLTSLSVTARMALSCAACLSRVVVDLDPTGTAASAVGIISKL